MTTTRDTLASLYSQSRLTQSYARLKMRIIPFEEFSEFLPHEGHILDIGCGYGYTSNYLALDSDRRQVLGSDIDGKRVAAAQRTTGGRANIRFIETDARQLDLHHLDGIVMVDVLHHIPPPEHRAVLDDVFAKLKPGGRFVMRETDKKPDLRYYLFNYALEVLLYPFSERTNFYRSADLQRLLRDVGFVIDHVIPPPKYFMYTTVMFVCRKPAAR